MKEKCRLKTATGHAASQFGYGMSAEVEGDAYDKELDQAYAQSMANFSADHTNTTKTIDGLRKTNKQQAQLIVQQQQQLLMIQQQMTANAFA